MFIAGDDAKAKATVTSILHDFGWPNVVDFGGIASSRWLRPAVSINTTSQCNSMVVPTPTARPCTAAT